MSGRTVIVTGASSGIGEATARAFGAAGDRVVLAARRVERLQALAATLPESLVVAADLTKSEDIARVAAEALKRYERIDVLVNNAGLGQYDWLERLAEDDIRTEIQVNLVGTILMTRAVLPAMQAQGRGVIINVASVAGKIGTPTMSIYNATKFAVDGFSEALRREVRPQGIDVCVIYPGPVTGTELGAKRKRGAGLSASAGLRKLPGLQTNTDQVARAIVNLATRPRPRRVIPGLYRIGITLNVLLPSLVDAFVSRAARRARAAMTHSPS